MNLFWDLPGRFVEVGVTLTILDDPRTDDLYFWALQVGFEDAASGRRQGAAHTGPQWAAQHPGHGAVNWGGYGAVGELDGSRGWLPSASGNANSVDYPWRVGVPYRLTVARAPGDLLVSPMVWSEVFARCDASPVRVAWSNPAAIDERGDVHRVKSARVNYQSVADGGCSNTEVSVTTTPDGLAWLQSTATQRRTRPGTPLRLTGQR